VIAFLYRMGNIISVVQKAIAHLFQLNKALIA